MTKGDAIIVVSAIALVAVVWAVFYLIPKEAYNLVAVVKVDGREVARLPAASPDMAQAVIRVKGGDAIIEYGQGRARVMPNSKEFCPDGICWKTGWVSNPGQSAVCVPNHMTVTLVSSSSDVDSVVR
ncbi:MAG: NusG domain II-containing protein [Bacillota bacterium]